MHAITENLISTRRNVLMNLMSESTGYNDIKSWQKASGIKDDGIFGIISWNTLYKQLLKVKEIDFEGYYFTQAHPKRQIVWHHSAGWDNARGMFEWWKKDGSVHVATAIGITDDGTVTKGYDEGFWAHHIGARHPNNLPLNQQSVAVEICNWGGLTEQGGKLYSWANAEVPLEKVIELNYKGTRYYERYTEAEIQALKIWTLLVALRFDIPLDYREADMWQVSSRALAGGAGIFTHNSYPVGKNDVSPQPHLIYMAMQLKQYES